MAQGQNRNSITQPSALVRRAAQSELIEAVLRLFAIVVKADHRTTPEELDYVFHFLERIDDRTGAEAWMHEFERVLAQELPLENTVTELNVQFDYEHRLLLLLKTWELLLVEAFTDAERETAGRITELLEISPADAAAIQALFDPVVVAEQPVCSRVPAPQVKHIIACSRDQPGEGIPVTDTQGVLLDFVQLGDMFFMRQRSSASKAKSAEVSIDGRSLPLRFFVRLEPNHKIRCGGCTLRQRDLLFYFRNLNVHRGERSVYLRLENGLYRLSNTPQPSAAIRVDIGGDGLLLSPLGNMRVALNGAPLVTPARVGFFDQLRIDEHEVDLRELAAAIEGRSRVESFSLEDVEYSFRDGTVGLSGVSFRSQRGELVCVIGPSGCGKSTLLNIMNGSLRPSRGRVRFGGRDLGQFPSLRDRIGYVPQDDLLFENLTVFENLYYSARLRFGGAASSVELRQRVERVIDEIRLRDKRDTCVGDPVAKLLSGGDRKPLNIGLELLADADVLLLDEPTSGLSSKDAERIIALLQSRFLEGQIIFVVAHQPGARLLAMFDKILLLDVGGTLAFYGDVPSALEYLRTEGQTIAKAVCPTCKRFEPDVILDTLLRPQLGIDGAPTTERQFQPDFWRKRFRARPPAPVRAISHSSADDQPVPSPRASTLVSQLGTLLLRDLKNKWRNPSNLITTFLGAPALGALIAWTLAPAAYLKNEKYPQFLFLSVIVALFLALSGSVVEFIRDRGVMLRESLLGVRASCYLFSKLINLTLYSAIQLVLYLFAAFALLRPEALFVHYAVYLVGIGLSATAIGLFISALPRISEKAATNLVPILLIPQILFAGSSIFPFKDMQHLPRAKSTTVPLVAQFMPSRWAYDGLLSVHAHFSRARPFEQLERPLAENLDVYRRVRDGGDPDQLVELHKRLIAAMKTAQPLLPPRIFDLGTKKLVENPLPDLIHGLSEADATEHQDKVRSIARDVRTQLNQEVEARIFDGLREEIDKHEATRRFAFFDARLPAWAVDAIILGGFTIVFCALTLLLLRLARRA